MAGDEGGVVVRRCLRGVVAVERARERSWGGFNGTYVPDTRALALMNERTSRFAWLPGRSEVKQREGWDVWRKRLNLTRLNAGEPDSGTGARLSLVPQ